MGTVIGCDDGSLPPSLVCCVTPKRGLFACLDDFDIGRMRPKTPGDAGVAG